MLESKYVEVCSRYESNICLFKHTANNDSDARVLAMNVENVSLGKLSVPAYGKPKYFGNKGTPYH